VSGSVAGDTVESKNTRRICEYCEVKLDNPQIERFYELNKEWQIRRSDIIEQKIAWYQESVDELEAYIRSENQSLSQADLDYYS